MTADPPPPSASQAPPKEAPPKDRDRPRDAAALIVVDHSTGEPRVLMGRRRADLVFLPNKFVFPGGRVDRADYTAPALSELPEGERTKLQIEMKGTPSDSRPRALAMAALRETFEEAGLLIGSPNEGGELARGLAADGRSGHGWPDFQALGVLPRLAGLSYIARAITPPGRPRRYDTRFFTVEASEIARRVEVTDGELSGLDWFNLDDMRSLDLPGITRVVIEDLADWLAAGFPQARRLPVPFYFHKNGTFERSLLRPADAPTTHA